MTKLNEINPSMAKGIVSVHVHPEYDRSTQSKDIAIMELNDDLNFNTKVKKIDLPRFEEETPVNAYGYASGWGKLSENGPTSVNLQGVGLQFLSEDDCSGYGNFDSKYMQCAGSLEGTVDTCQVSFN